MLFHTSFGPVREGLPAIRNDLPIHTFFLTFAISPQLFCASLIVLRRCSSAGVHGVFVRLFLGAFEGGIDSPRGSMESPRPPGSPNPVGGIDDNPGIPVMPGCLRFLDDGGDVGGG